MIDFGGRCSMKSYTALMEESEKTMNNKNLPENCLSKKNILYTKKFVFNFVINQYSYDVLLEV